MAIGLTARQTQLLSFIEDKIAAVGYPPTYEQMTEFLGVRSKSVAHRMVDCMVERGLVRRLPHRARALEIVHVGETGMRINPLPEIRKAIAAYAAEQRITEQTAIEEACRAYFMGPWER